MFEYVWYDKNGTNLRIIAHSSQPMSGASGCRQYDLFIDGKSFFTLPKVYEVGLKSSSVQDGRVPGIITKADRLRLEYNSPYSTYSQTTSEQVSGVIIALSILVRKYCKKSTNVFFSLSSL
jgi:hypothetical protein